MSHNVNLSWTASPDPSVSGYNVYRGAAAGQETTKLNSALVTTTTYDDTTAVDGENFYVVKAVAVVNGVQVEAAPTNEVSVSLPPLPATDLTIVSSN
jgi:hypothetical protein